ncbi:hypothetical protein PM082_008719 [Marasmius tenuissimus]|nr:hypothetical protein PM082_008719 [Marasmius tenuissimus]
MTHSDSVHSAWAGITRRFSQVSITLSMHLTLPGSLGVSAHSTVHLVHLNVLENSANASPSSGVSFVTQTPRKLPRCQVTQENLGGNQRKTRIKRIGETFHEHL